MTNAQEQITPESPIIAKIIQGARENVKANECLLPVFFIGNHDGMKIIAAPFENEHEKAMAAWVVKETAKRENADFVLFVAESYTIKDQAAVKEFLANRDKYPSLSEHPQAIEVVVFSLETHSGRHIGMAEIAKDRALQEIKWSDNTTKTEGRFACLLPNKVIH